MNEIADKEELQHYYDMQKLPNGIVLFDYENIYQRLLEYGKNIIELNLIDTLKEFFTEKGINLLDIRIYANFDAQEFHSSFHQTYLQGLGVTTIHTANMGKNSADIQLAVDALKILFKNSLVDVFIVISSDRDMAPLIQAIKQENKLTYLITTKNGFERTMMSSADYHEYLENILNLSLNYRERDPGISRDKISRADTEAAREIVALLLTSKIWERYSKRGNPILFDEFKKHIARAKRMLPIEVDRLFKIARELEWIELYKFKCNSIDETGLKGGNHLDEVLTSDVFKEQFNS